MFRANGLNSTNDTCSDVAQWNVSNRNSRSSQPVEQHKEEAALLTV